MTPSERKDRVGLRVFKLFVRLFAAFGGYKALARFFSRFVVELDDGQRRTIEFRAARDGRIGVLVLDYERFRGDVDIFAKAEDTRILLVSWNLLRHLLAAYVRPTTNAEDSYRPGGRIPRVDFALAKAGSRLFKGRQRYRKFLRRFLPEFLNGLGVDVIINSDFRFRREMDFVRVCSEIGYPHICYYREALAYTVPANYHYAVARHSAFAPFYGHVIAVQNEITRRMFIDSAIAPPEQIVVRGCPRMDDFLVDIDQPELPKNDTKRVAYFSCPKGVSLEDGTYFDLFTVSCEVVRALIELAFENPELSVVLKMKDLHIKGSRRGQIEEFETIIQEVTGCRTLSNVEFLTDMRAAQDIIRASDIIIAMQTTVALEAAIVGKPVMLPHLKVLREQQGASQALMYQEHRELFDVPEDMSDFKTILRRRLDDPTVEPTIVDKRRTLFAEHVSPLLGNATELSLNLIREAAKSRTRKRDISLQLQGSMRSNEDEI